MKMFQIGSVQRFTVTTSSEDLAVTVTRDKCQNVHHCNEYVLIINRNFLRLISFIESYPKKGSSNLWEVRLTEILINLFPFSWTPELQFLYFISLAPQDMCLPNRDTFLSCRPLLISSFVLYLMGQTQWYTSIKVAHLGSWDNRQAEMSQNVHVYMVLTSGNRY